MDYAWKEILETLTNYRDILASLRNSDQDFLKKSVVHQAMSKYLESLHATSLEMVKTYNKVAMRVIEEEVG